MKKCSTSTGIKWLKVRGGVISLREALLLPTRRAAIALLFLILASGCGGGKCASSYTGTYTDTAGSTEVFDASCSFSYADSSGCKSSGTYGVPLASSGTSQLVIQTSTGGSCLAAGTYSCSFAFSGTTSGSKLTGNCGAGSSTFTKQ